MVNRTIINQQTIHSDHGSKDDIDSTNSPPKHRYTSHGRGLGCLSIRLVNPPLHHPIAPTNNPDPPPPGAMASLSAFVIPVLLGTNAHDPAHTTRQWALLYIYGRQYLPVLCIATCGLYGSAILSRKKKKNRGDKPSSSRRYAFALVSTIAMVPFTWLAMAPTNDILFRLETMSGNATVEGSVVRGLAVKWAWLHVVRSIFPLVGAFLGFTGLLSELELAG